MLRPLTALRFLFAWMVFVSHCVIYLPNDSTAALRLREALREGFIGVNFFFVLSGFILAYNYSDRLQAGRISKKTFWIRRFARIYPLYLLSLLLTAALSWVTIREDPAAFWKQFAWCLPMLQVYPHQWQLAYALNAPAWSVADEAFFYLLFPAIAAATGPGRPWKLPLAVVLVLLPAAMLLVPASAGRAVFYFSPFSRIIDFALGILLYRGYLWLRGRSWSSACATRMELASLLLFVAFLAFSPLVPLVFRYSVYYWIPVCCLVLVFALSGGWLSRRLSGRVPVLLGELSFAFYLLHHPVALGQYILLRKLDIDLPAPAYICLYFCLTLAASFVLHFMFERPANTWLRRKLLPARGSAV